MKVVSVAIVIVFVVLAVFTAANWSILTASTPLSFVAFDIEGPLGVILLLVMLGLTLLIVTYALTLRTSWLVESRRLNRQLEEQRELAERAESSRLLTLQEIMEREYESLKASLQTHSESGLARIEQAEHSIVKNIEDSANSVMAHIGYLDDKLKGGA